MVAGQSLVFPQAINLCLWKPVFGPMNITHSMRESATRSGCSVTFYDTVYVVAMPRIHLHTEMYKSQSR